MGKKTQSSWRLEGAIGAGGGYDAGVVGESRVSSVGGGGMAALGRKGPTKTRNG